jgi:DNA-binding response OmpR family regulator
MAARNDRLLFGAERDFGDGAPAAGASVQRVLVVEDEFLLACSLDEDLRSFGYSVVGPFTRLARALDASRHERFDLAVLDINLNGEMVYPLAQDLMVRGIPFLFLSGYGTANLPERFRAAPRLAKPYDPKLLLREIRRILPEAG